MGPGTLKTSEASQSRYHRHDRPGRADACTQLRHKNPEQNSSPQQEERLKKKSPWAPLGPGTFKTSEASQSRYHRHDRPGLADSCTQLRHKNPEQNSSPQQEE